MRYLLALCLLLLPSFAIAQPFNGGNASGVAVQYTNEGTTGTAFGMLVKTANAPQVAISAQTTDTIGIIGICKSGCGKTGTSIIQETGIGQCSFDGSVTAGDFVQNSSTSAGKCHDTGAATYPTTVGEVIGRVQITASGPGLYPVNLFSPDVVSPSGSGSGTVNSAPLGSTPYYSAATTISGGKVLSACAFAGATADVQINAAMAALPAGGGTIDLTCYGATNQTIAAQVTIGSCTTKPTVNVIVDPATVFTCTIAGGGAGTCWLLNSGTNMWASRNTGAYTHVTNQGFTGSSTANVATIMQVGNSASCGATLFTSIKGLSFFQETTSPTVTKAVLWYDSPSNAGSIEDVTVFGWNQPAAYGILADNNNGFGPLILLNNEVDSGYQSCTPLKIAQASTTGYAGITVEGGEYQHPGTGVGCGQSIWLQSFSSCSVALSPVTLLSPHVESGNATDSDILIDGAQSVTSIGTWATAGNNGAATNLFKIQNRAGGCAADHINLIGTTNWNSGVSTNDIANTPSGYNSGAANVIDYYHYATSGLGYINDQSTANAMQVVKGGVISLKGGTPPTITAGCNGAGLVNPASPSTDNKGTFTSQSSAATTCTLTFNHTWPQAPQCTCWDNNASTSPVGCSTGATSQTTAVFDFASTTSRTWGYSCW